MKWPTERAPTTTLRVIYLAQRRSGLALNFIPSLPLPPPLQLCLVLGQGQQRRRRRRDEAANALRRFYVNVFRAHVLSVFLPLRSTIQNGNGRSRNSQKSNNKREGEGANKKQKMKTKDIRRFRLLPPPAHCACSFGILFKMDYAGNDDESSRFNTLKKTKKKNKRTE